MRPWLLAPLGVALLGCPSDPVDSDTGDAPVNDGPSLVHTPVTVGDEGVAIPLVVEATDEDGVDKVALFFRTVGEAAWETVYLTPSGTSWSGEIPGDQVAPPGLEYYFRAQDSSDAHAPSYAPDAGAQDPYDVAVAIVGLTVPYEEDFEAEDTLYELGWDESSASFSGYAFAIEDSRAVSGVQSIGHRRGVADLDPLDDWLVSPPLDLSTLATAEVSWQEWGDQVDLANHSLWISTTSAEPTDGETPEEAGWELVTALEAPPEGAWARSTVVDLTPWAGSAVVWLAWRYEGEFADAWYIDDVAVRELGADIHLVSWDWAPDPVDPGATTTVSLDVENRTTVASGPITVTWTVDPMYGTFVSPVTAAAIDPLGTARWSTDLTLSASVPDNSYVPFTVYATDGTRTWTWSDELVVGVPSSAHISLDHDADGLLEVHLGVGDPASPDVDVPVVLGPTTAGDLDWTVDLTDYYASLPPAPGATRWWVSVASDSAGALEAFEISWDGVTYTSDDLGAWAAGDEVIFYLPRPPEPEITASSTSPDPVQPGDTVAWTATLHNAGAATTGETTVTLTSSDPDVTVLTPDPIVLSSTSWAEGASADLALQIAVADTHTDSTPVQVELVVTDEAESFVVDAEIEVPWPVLQVTGVRVDDWSDGDDDGLLDDGETANLEIDLSNLGDLDSFGSVSCVLSQVGGAASVVIVEAEGSFGLVTRSNTKTEDDFEVTASGSVGEDVQMLLACVDTTGMTYDSTFELVIGEPPWLTIHTIDDECGDAVSGYEFDIKNGRYRSDGTTLEIELDSCTPYDPSTVFIESWASSVGADYNYYQLVVQSGIAKLRGYDGTFTTLTTPTIAAVDDDTLAIEFELAPLGLSLERFNMGFASGFCGGEAIYCDQFADDWGYPYNGETWNPTAFYPMSW